MFTTNNNIKALINLLVSQPSKEGELKSRLADIIKNQPLQFREVIANDYGGELPDAVSDVLTSIHRESLKGAFESFFKKNGSTLLEGVVLLNRFIDVNIKEKDITSYFNLLAKDLASTADGSFDIFHRAEIFQKFFFSDFGFRLEALSEDERFLSLADSIRRRRTSPLMLSVIYVLAARHLDMDAAISYTMGKPVVCCRDIMSGEPVFIDITAKGQFVGERQCKAYALTRGYDFDSENVISLSTKEVIKRLISNLIFVYSRKKGGASAAQYLREYLKAS